jgi:transposase
VEEIAEVHDREVRDLPCFEYRTTVVIELNRLRCPNCGVKAARAAQLPSKAPFSKRFDKGTLPAQHRAMGARLPHHLRPFHIIQHANAPIDEVRRALK